MKQRLLQISLAVGALLMNYPFIWMVMTAFMSLEQATSSQHGIWPETWNWTNFEEAWQAAPFARYFLNTLFISLTVTGFVVLTSLMAGYALAKIPFKGRGILFALILSTMMVPFEASIIPNFVIISKLGWYNTYAALIVPWCANAFSIFLVRQAFRSVPNDFIDAAKMDGCGEFKFIFTLGFHLVRPMMITVALFAFLGSYNSLIWPLVVTSSESLRVIQVGLTVFSGDAGVRVNLLMAASTIVILPTALLYLMTQKYLLEGAQQAGIRG
jgi:ABC-type glycerol-3-phosphate transport system permease component